MLAAARSSVKLLLLAAACIGPAHAQSAAAPIAGVFMEAERAFQQGDNARAIELFSEIVRQDGNQPHAWARLGVLHRREGHLYRSLEAWAEVLRIYPTPDVAPDAGSAIREARIERSRAYVMLAQVELDAVPPSASGEIDRAHSQFSQALYPVARVAAELALDDEFSRLVAQPKRSGRARGEVVDITHRSGERSSVGQRPRSSVPVIVGDSEE